MAPKWSKIAPKPSSQASKSSQIRDQTTTVFGSENVLEAESPCFLLFYAENYSSWTFSWKGFEIVDKKIFISSIEDGWAPSFWLLNPSSRRSVARLRNRPRIRDHAATVFGSENVLEASGTSVLLFYGQNYSSWTFSWKLFEIFGYKIFLSSIEDGWPPSIGTRSLSS